MNCTNLRFTRFALPLLFFCMNAQAQLLVPPLEQPNLDAQQPARVDSVIRLSDGRYLIGGLFERVGAANRAGIARLNADGSLDTGFSAPDVPNARDFAVDSQGRVYALSNSLLIRLLPNGSRDASFPSITATPGGTLRAIEIDNDQLFVSGGFTSIAGSARNRLAKLSLSGIVDPNWLPEPNALVLGLLAPGNGFIYAGGSFTQIGGATRTGLARIGTAGNGLADAWNPVLAGSGSAVVRAIAADASALYVSGTFFTVNGVNRSQLAKIDLAGSAQLDAAFAGGLSNPADLLSVQGGFVYAGRDSFPFNASSGAASLTATRLARFTTANAALDTAFVPFADTPAGESASVFAVAAGDGGGRLVVAGSFAALSAGVIRLSLASLNANGSFDALSALPEASSNASWTTAAIDTDGSVYLRGTFRRVNGGARRDVVKLNPAGGVDSSFRPPNVPIDALALDPGLAVYVADRANSRILKLDRVSGDPVAGFTPINYTNVVGSMEVAGAHLYAYGSFTLSGITPLLGSYARVRLSDGSVDQTYRPTFGASFEVPSQTLFDSASNALILRGSFTAVNGAARAGIAKLNATTAVVDANWNPLFGGGTPIDAALDDQGGLSISGNFSSVNGAACRAPARLLLAGNGVLDSAFSCARPTGFTQAIAYADGAIYASGAGDIQRFALAANGSSDSNWQVNVSAPAVLRADARRLFILGSYSTVSGLPRAGLAAVPLVERFGANGFE